MEEQIKHIAKSQRIVYVIFWAVAILLVVGGETELLPVGLFADDVRTSYYLETIGILLTAINIPFSMKLFSLVLTRKIDNLTFPVALSRYAVWSHIRLGLLAIVVVYNLLCYYIHGQDSILHTFRIMHIINVTIQVHINSSITTYITVSYNSCYNLVYAVLSCYALEVCPLCVYSPVASHNYS